MAPRESREAQATTPAPPRSHRDHPDDRRHVLSPRDLHAGLALAPELALARGEPAAWSSPADAGCKIRHPNGHRDGQILINQAGVTLDTLVAALRPLVSGADTSVIVAVDSAAPSGVVVQAMLKARDAGAEHFLF